MPLPNPTYLAPAYYQWNGRQFDAALIDDSAPGSPAIATGRRDIRWDALDNIDKQVVHDLIMGYAARDAKAEAVALTIGSVEAYQVIDYNVALVGGDVAGLEDGITYTASAVINGTEFPIKVIGVASDTITNVLTKINADLTGATIAINADANFELSSDVVGAGQVVEMFDQNLFSSIAGFKLNAFEEKRVGVNNIGDVFDLNFRDGYQSYAELLIGALRLITHKPYGTAKDNTQIYFNHSTATWLKRFDDSAA